jgi:hypothetical protein
VKELSTCSEFYDGVSDWLLLFNHCALKTTNEAVVESMGCTLDVHANPVRHLEQDNYVKETVDSGGKGGMGQPMQAWTILSQQY